MLLLRKIHLYLGMLFAPTIIFFAFSGAMQTFGLHEAEKADANQPPAWIVTLAELHKEQRLSHPKTQKPPGALDAMRAERANAAQDVAAAPGAGSTPAAEQASITSQTILKFFVLLMAVGLILSAALGILIAFRNTRTRRAAGVALAIGMVLPLTLIFL